ncbi:hypothetical protein DFJ77DRAFT_476574 [Powellomyces hirtus]|nr:hypothetical protein DFJ77DRAFT_476574 [Powellomyces hirtus]
MATISMIQLVHDFQLSHLSSSHAVARVLSPRQKNGEHLSPLPTASMDQRFDNWIETKVAEGESERRARAKEVRRAVEAVAKKISSLWVVELRGSISKGTDVIGSDIDMVVCVSRKDRVSKPQRQKLRNALENAGIGKNFNTGTNAITFTLLLCSEQTVDVSFQASYYGPGKLPRTPETDEAFKSKRPLRQVVRAFKYIALKRCLPRAQGVFWEQLVLVTYRQARPRTAWTLFQEVLRKFSMSTSLVLTKWINENGTSDPIQIDPLAITQGQMGAWRNYAVSARTPALNPAFDMGDFLLKSSTAPARTLQPLRVTPSINARPTAGATAATQVATKAQSIHKCSSCNRGPFDSELALKNHKVDYHGDRPSGMCTICFRSFKKPKGLAHHRAVMHPN